MNDPLDWDAKDSASPAAPKLTERLPFAFTGSGSEYFRIWIVNLLLTIVTLGIYSAWAKVRRTKYFYHNTVVAGSSFEYHGKPIAILKGRLIAAGLFVVYNGVLQTGNAALIAATMLGFALALPWLLWKSLQFRAWNTSWRGVRMGFGGTLGEAYLTFILWPLLAMISLYALFPLAHHQIKLWQHSKARFGETAFSMQGCAGGFYGAYLMALGLVVLGVSTVIGLAAFAGVSGGAQSAIGATLFGVATLFLLSLAIWPLVTAKLFNTVWSHTALGPHQFTSQIPLGQAAFVGVTNLFGIVLTLGLFKPWAAVRWAKLCASHVSVLAVGSLDDFTAASQTQSEALGEGVADLAGFDLGL